MSNPSIVHNPFYAKEVISMRRSPLLYAIITVLWLVIAIIRFSDGFTWSGLVAVIGSVLFFALAIYHFLKNRSGGQKSS